jgi:hypothetical protein
MGTAETPADLFEDPENPRENIHTGLQEDKTHKYSGKPDKRRL